MGRSSRILIFSMILATGPIAAAPVAADGVFRFGHGRDRIPVGRVFGRSYLGPSYFDGAYFGSPGGAVAPAGDEPSYGPPGIGVGPRRCALPPLVIRVGRGLAHPAATRVTYGAPPCAF